ncbi:YhgE/Pip family protein, partial [Marmoricola sp. RAF53]|uniref:YhgE/Pip domain-containing protein n=1 Tax=Marmoricola sp. RAF53 TaxID=3233059 RepID=UPI003F99190F
MSETAAAPGPRHRWTRQRGIRVVVVGLLLPLLAALVLVWATWDRRTEFDKIPVAVVNNDQVVTSPTTVAAGRELAGSLTDPSSSDPTGSDVQLSWKLTDSDDATAGLRSGEYYAVLTIPKDFSKQIVSTSGDDPERGQIRLESNAAASESVPFLSLQVAAAAATALGNQSTQGYLKNVYGGFNQIAQSNQKAATSAGQLATGTGQLSEGAAQLDDGANTLAGSMARLASGADDLQSGTAEVSSGSSEVARGANAVSQGARKVDQAAGKLAGGADKVADRGATFATRAGQAARLATGVSEGAARVSSGAAGLATALDQLAQQCAGSGASAAFCAQLDGISSQAGTHATGAGELARGAQASARADDALASG